MGDKMKEWILNLFSWSLGFFDSSISDAIGILTGNSFNVLTTAQQVSGVFTTVCTTILGICVLSEIAVYSTRVDTMRWEHAVKIGVKIAFAKACCDNVQSLITSIYKQSQAWATNIGSFTGASGSAPKTISDAKDRLDAMIPSMTDNLSGLGMLIGFFLTTIVVILAVIACSIMIKVMAYGRIFEVLAYVIISPVPCAFLPLTGTSEFGINSITKSFFKSYIGVCMQGVVMMVCLRVFDLLVTSSLYKTLNQLYVDVVMDGKALGVTATIAHISDAMWLMVMGSVALVIAVSKSGSWAKSMMGA